MRTRKAFFYIALLLVLCFSQVALAATDQATGGHNLLNDIGMAIVAATIIGILASFLRQPSILAFILAGVILGPKLGLGLITDEVSIEVISEIGLILLLFIIGLEIDIKKLLRAGKPVVWGGLTQFPICVLFALAFFTIVMPLRSGQFDLLYLAVAVSLSSTMIVVKLLYDKVELDTLAGRITLGVLVFQDIWAILFLAIQPNLTNPQPVVLLAASVKGLLLVGAAFAVSKYLLPYIFKAIAKMPEIVLVTSVAWCFLLAGLAQAAGLSREMGALVAGVSLSTFPYSLDVIAKVTSIRDFFVTLFFVALGMKIPQPSWGVLGMAAATSVFIMASRFMALMPLLSALKMGHRISILTSLNLAQMSEFALVIVALGETYGHVGDQVMPLVVFTLIITATSSTYVIKYSHPLQAMIEKLFVRVGWKDTHKVTEAAADEENKAIAILGLYKVASSFIDELIRLDYTYREKIMVVDFNPEVYQELHSRGIAARYGDIANTDTLHHAGVDGADLIISTIPDAILRGTNNLRLLQQAKQLVPSAKVIVTSDTISQAHELYQAGADYVLLPRVIVAKELAEIILNATSGELERRRLQEQSALNMRDEVLA